MAATEVDAKTEVGTAYVTIIPSAKGFARNLQKEIAKEFAGSNLDKAIAEALGDRKPVKLPVQPEVDPTKVPDELPVRPGREPKLPVELDPLAREFQAEVRRQVSALSREVSASIPIGADTAELRSELAAEIARLERELAAEIPTEPAKQREYEARVRALVNDVEQRVRARIPVEVDVDRNRLATSVLQTVRSAMGQLSSAASTVVGAVSSATSSLTGLATTLLAVGSAMSLSVSGAYLLGGAIGALPGAIAGAAAAIGVLSLGLTGIVDRLEEAATGADIAEEELAKLAPAAREVVGVVKGLAPAFEQLRLGVQQKLFAGLGGVVRNLAQAWLPQLTKTLGTYADTFNRLVKAAAKSVSQKSFIDNISAGAESARRALERVGKAVSGPLVEAFGRLSRAAGPLIERLGDEVAQLVEDFASWIEQVDRSGSLDQFFTRAGQILSDLVEMGRDVASIFGSIMSILFGKESITNSPWNALRDTLDQLADWFKDPENQEKVRGFFDDVEKFLTQDLPSAIRTAKSVIDTVDGWLDTVERWRERIDQWRARVQDAARAVGAALLSLGWPVTWVINQFGRLRDGAARQAQQLVAWMRGLPGRIVAALGNTGGLLWQAGRNIVQGLIDGIRSRLPSVGSTMRALAGLIAAYLPHSPAKLGPLSGRGSPYHSGQSIARMLAAGVTDTLGAVESAAANLASVLATTGSSPVPAGGRIARVAEAGQAEAIIPLDEIDRVLGPRGGDTYYLVGTATELLDRLQAMIRAERTRQRLLGGY